MLRELIQYIFTKFYFLKFLSPHFYLKKMSTSSLEAELQKSTLETQPAVDVIDTEKADKFKEEGNEAFKSIIFNLGHFRVN